MTGNVKGKGDCSG